MASFTEICFCFSGECECREGFLPWHETEGSAETCYQEFLQGPCPENHQLLLENDKSVCRISDCPNHQIRWKNGACIDPIDCPDEDYQVGAKVRVLGETSYMNVEWGEKVEDMKMIVSTAIWITR